MKRGRGALLGTGLLMVAAGCHQDMWNQPVAKPQSKSDTMYSDALNSRLPVAGAVSFGGAKTDKRFFTGFDENGKMVKEFPLPVDEALLKRGKERFKIFCTPCHGELGNGKGFIAQRGFTMARPVGNYHSDRLRKMPVGHFFDVITNGYGTMYPFRARIKPRDRWAIAAYIRVLQESQHTSINDIPADKRAELEALPRSPEQDAPPEPALGVTPSRDLNAPGGAVTTVPLGRQGVPSGSNGAQQVETATTPPAGTARVAPGGAGH